MSQQENIEELKNKYDKTLRILALAEKEKAQAKQLAATVQEECHSLREQQKTLRTMIARSKGSDDLQSELEKLRQQFNVEREQSDNLQKELEKANAQNQLQSQRIEKLLLALKNREGKLNELQQFEYGFKKAHQQRNSLENVLETEQNINTQLKEEAASLRSALHESKLHAEHLETVIVHLREKSEDAKIENLQLETELASAQGAIDIYQEQLKNTEEELITIKNSLHHLEHEKSTSDQELTALRSQLTAMKETVKKTWEELADLDKLKQEKRRLEEAVSEKDASLAKAREEGTQLQHTVKHLQCETKEFANRIHESVKEKNNAMSKFYQIQHTLEGERAQTRALEEKLRQKEAEIKKLLETLYLTENQRKELQVDLNGRIERELLLSKEIQDLKNQLAVKNSEYDNLKTELEKVECLEKEKADIFEKYDQLKIELSELTELHEEVLEGRMDAERQLEDVLIDRADKEEVIKILQEEVISLTAGLNDENENGEKLRQQLTDSEAKFMEAQQHLGKKVKETAQYLESIELMEEKIHELENELKTIRKQAEEAEGHLEFQKQQEKRLQDQITKWEEKYFRVYEQWQEADAQKKEFKSLQGKHQQLQTLLSNLGNFMGGNIAFPQQKPSFDDYAPQQPKQLHDENKDKNLWDMPEAPSKPKNMLFD